MRPQQARAVLGVALSSHACVHIYLTVIISFITVISARQLLCLTSVSRLVSLLCLLVWYSVLLVCFVSSVYCLPSNILGLIYGFSPSLVLCPLVRYSVHSSGTLSLYSEVHLVRYFVSSSVYEVLLVKLCLVGVSSVSRRCIRRIVALTSSVSVLIRVSPYDILTASQRSRSRPHTSR